LAASSISWPSPWPSSAPPPPSPLTPSWLSTSQPPRAGSQERSSDRRIQMVPARPASPDTNSRAGQGIRTRPMAFFLLSSPDLGSRPGIGVPQPPARGKPGSSASAAPHVVAVAVLCCCTIGPAVRIRLLTCGDKRTRTPNPLLANNWQHVHPRPSPQVTVPEPVSASLQIRTCCATFVLYAGAWSGDCPAGHYPLHRLAGETRNQVEVACRNGARSRVPARPRRRSANPGNQQL
jgi:hypothetical protein